MRRLIALPLLALALALAACDDEPPTACFLPNASAGDLSSAGGSTLSIAALPAVLVAVQDSVTGEDLAPGARGAFVVGTYADSLRHGWDGPLVAWGPAGRYSLVVQRAGYAIWGTNDVRVVAGDCGPRTETITARLQPAPGPQ